MREPKVLRFRPGRAPNHGAGRLTNLRDRARAWLGRLLLRLGSFGIVRDFDYLDPARGWQVRIVVSALAVRLSVDGRDYYFDRFTGAFEGVGSAPQLTR